MNTKKLKFTGIILGIILCFAVIFAMSFYFFDRKTAHATSKIQEEIFLPTSKEENTPLSSIIETCYNNGSYGIIQDSGVLFLTPNGTTKLDSGDSVVHTDKVAFFEDGYAVILDDGILTLVNLSNGQLETLQYNNKPIGCTSFDLSKNYLVIVLGENNNGLIRKYNVSGHTLSAPLSFEGPETDKPISGKKPIAINNQNVYFVISDTIFYLPLDDFDCAPTALVEASPSKMIANDEFLYIIESESLYKIDLSNGNKTQLTINSQLYDFYTEYELGNFTKPSSISFKGDNLLITDKTLDAVQEFIVNGDKLEFTGYAIADGKTAYNRIGKSADKIERYGDFIVVKDQLKLTVIKNSEEFDGKTIAHFKNFFIDKLGDVKDFAVGDGKILLCYNDNSIETINIDTPTIDESTKTTLPYTIKDVAYVNNVFYLATSDGENSYVYSVDKQNACSPAQKLDGIKTVELYTRDQANNTYIVTNRTLLKNGEVITTFDLGREPTEIQIDLDGTIYLLINGQISVVNNNKLAVCFLEQNVKAFTLSFDKKEVYFLKDNQEIIYKTNALDNHAIDGLEIPKEYKLTDSKAYVESLAICTINQGAGTYSVDDQGSTFTFNSVIIPENQYLFICDVVVSESTTLTALAGQKGIVLVDKQFITKTSAEFYSHPPVSFVTTGVHVYYLPIITMDNKFVLTENETGIRLEKGAKISPIKAFKAINRDYYYAEISVGGKTYLGYIPKEFTVDILAEDKTYTNFTLAKVMQTKVYFENDLVTEISTLQDQTTVRIASQSNGVAEIYFEKDGSWIKGYISSEVICVEKNNSIRNAIMLLVAVTCVCFTIIYFMFRKKS